MIERRSFHRGHLVGVFAVVVAAAVLGHAWYDRVRIAQDFSHGTSGLFWVAAVVIAIVALLLAARFVSTQKIAVRDGTLSVKGGGRALAIPAGEVAQIYSQPPSAMPTGHQVAVVLRNGEHRVLVAHLDLPEQALFIEQRIEAALGLDDAAVSGEISRNERLEALPRRSPLKLMVGYLALPVAVAGMAVGLRACGQPLGALAVPIAGGPSSLTLELGEPQRLKLAVEWTLEGSYVREHNADHRRTADLPQDVRLYIEVESGDEHRTLRCNPFDFFLWTNGNTGDSWTLYGPLEDCLLEVERGRTTVTARLTGDLDRFAPASLTLIPMR